VLTYCGAGDAARKARHVCFRGPKHELPQGAPPPRAAPAATGTRAGEVSKIPQ